MVFAIHWHESAMDLHVFPIPIPPAVSLPIPIPLGLPSAPGPALVSCIQPGLLICFTLDNILVSMLWEILMIDVNWGTGKTRGNSGLRKHSVKADNWKIKPLYWILVNRESLFNRVTFHRTDQIPCIISWHLLVIKREENCIVQLPEKDESISSECKFVCFVYWLFTGKTLPLLRLIWYSFSYWQKKKWHVLMETFLQSEL